MDKKSEVYKVLNTYGTQVINEMKTRLVNLGKVATGSLLKSLKYNIEDTEDGLTLFILANDYVDYVDKGRPAGKMPPIDNIKQWCKVKGIDEGAAWPIAKNISKFGIPPTNFYTISVTRRAKQLDKLLKDAAQKDAAKLLENTLK